LRRRPSSSPCVTYIDVAHLFTVAGLALIDRGVQERAGAEPDVPDADERGWSWLEA